MNELSTSQNIPGKGLESVRFKQLVTAEEHVGRMWAGSDDEVDDDRRNEGYVSQNMSALNASAPKSYPSNITGHIGMSHLFIILT